MRNVQEAGLTDLENQMKQEELAFCHLIDLGKTIIEALLLKENSKMKMCKKLQLEKSGDCIIPLSCRRRSFYQSPQGKPRWEPTMLVTTSKSDGIDSSLEMTAWRRLERDFIQLRYSAPFKGVAINYVIEKGSKYPKTAEETICRHRFERRRSKTGHCTSLWLYPIPNLLP